MGEVMRGQVGNCPNKDAAQIQHRRVPHCPDLPRLFLPGRMQPDPLRLYLAARWNGLEGMYMCLPGARPGAREYLGRYAMRRRKSDADLAKLLYPKRARAPEPPAGMTPEQQAAVDRLNRAMAMITTTFGPVEGRTLLVTTLTIHLVELLMQPVGPQFVELFNQGISTTPWQLTKRTLN
jgi:hypothetical protein